MNLTRVAGRATAFCLLGFAVMVLIPRCAVAIHYDVNRVFADGVSTATLTGTLDIPAGHYILQNPLVDSPAPNPFTDVNLVLTVNGTPYSLTHALTGLIFGSAEFIIDATPTRLIFDTANSDGGNPADLVFSDTTNVSLKNRYGIGADYNPGFEVADTNAGSILAEASFPTVFGTSVPEPSTFILAALGALALLASRRRR